MIRGDDRGCATVGSHPVRVVNSKFDNRKSTVLCGATGQKASSHLGKCAMRNCLNTTEGQPHNPRPGGSPGCFESLPPINGFCAAKPSLEKRENQLLASADHKALHGVVVRVASGSCDSGVPDKCLAIDTKSLDYGQNFAASLQTPFLTTSHNL